MDKHTKDELFWSYMELTGSAPSEQELNSYLNNGKSYHDNEEDLKKWVNEKGLPYHKYKAQKEQEVSDLQAQVRTLTQQLAQAQKPLDSEENAKKIKAFTDALNALNAQ